MTSRLRRPDRAAADPAILRRPDRAAADPAMRYAMTLPGGTATEQLDLALLAEESGWDGVFVWEAAYGVDAWSLLAAIAARTTMLRLGTLLTPLPWRRPWKVASQAATVDQISSGRVILTVGLGATTTDLPRTGDTTNLRIRADQMDEGIDLIRRLWEGHSSYHGHHYDYECDRDDLATVGRPVQERIPIWVVGVWPRPKSMRRVVRCDGLVPQYQFADREGAPEDVRAIRAWLADHGARSDLDIVAEGETPADDADAARDLVAPWAEAGSTWWVETRWEMPHHSPQRLADVRERLTAGPPRPRMR